MNIKGLTNDELLRYGGLDDSLVTIEAQIEISRRVLAGEWSTDEIEELESQIEELESQIKELKGTNAELTTTVENLRQTLRDTAADLCSKADET